MGKTLWEMLKAKAKGPIELQITNPLKLKVGTNVRVDSIDLKDLVFSVKRVLEYKRDIGGQSHFFTDYDLLARPFGSDEVKLRLRLNPMESPDPASGLTHNVVLLRSYEEMAYDKGLHDVLKDTTKLFEVLEDGVCTERYYRINDVQDPYGADVTVLKEGDTDLDALEKYSVSYWDYWRETTDEAGTKFNQFLFVEMDNDSGYFWMWRGEETIPENVSVI